MQNSLILNPSMDVLPQLKPFVEGAAEAACLDGKDARGLRLALEEAVVNVINYGQATSITLLAEVEADRLVLTIDDDGLPFDPTQALSADLTVPADLRPAGGMGIVLMHQMTDALGYQRKDGHNILRMEKLKGLCKK